MKNEYLLSVTVYGCHKSYAASTCYASIKSKRPVLFGELILSGIGFSLWICKTAAMQQTITVEQRALAVSRWSTSECQQLSQCILLCSGAK